MDRSRGATAADLVNSLSVAELTRLFADNGEGRFARRLAEGIVASRPIETTSRLVQVIDRSLPGVARKRAGHPAKRVFQALRIEVNEELEVLAAGLESALDMLSPGGRCVVLSYHSGEDRLVKQCFMRAASGGCVCPADLPCVCGAVGTVRVLTRGARLAERRRDGPEPACGKCQAAGRGAPLEAGRADGQHRACGLDGRPGAAGPRAGVVAACRRGRGPSQARCRRSPPRGVATRTAAGRTCCEASVSCSSSAPWP